MTPEEFLAEAERRLGGAGYGVERTSFRGVPAVLGRRKQFRVRWMLTQLKTTVVVCTADVVSYEGWYTFLQDAFGAAKGFVGGLPTGFQSGVGAVPVLAARQVDPAAAAAAANDRRASSCSRASRCPPSWT